MKSIDLSQPRTIVLTIGGHRYAYKFNPITKQNWFSYFDQIVNTSEQKKNEIIQEFDTSAARLALVDAALVSATGYRTPNGVSIDTPEMKAKLPIKHRQAVADQLLSVEARDQQDDDVIAIGSETVLLSAVWSADEDGVLEKFTQLRHEFESPTAEHFRSYRRDLSRSYIVGGSRSSRTVWRGAQKTLAAIYDELIVSVSGYTYNGGELSGREQIAANMDTYHKVVAVGQLFRPAETDEDGTEAA